MDSAIKLALGDCGRSAGTTTVSSGGLMPGSTNGTNTKAPLCNSSSTPNVVWNAIPTPRLVRLTMKSRLELMATG